MARRSFRTPAGFSVFASVSAPCWAQDFKEAYMTKEFNPDDDTRDDTAEDDLPMNDELTKAYSDLLMF